MWRWVYIVVGHLAVGLGVVGIFLPLLPTTPFLLLAAGCYAKGSDKFHQWLINHPQLGNYIRYYLSGEGMPAKAKAYTLLLLWPCMLFSCWLVNNWLLKGLLLIIACCVSYYIVVKVPTLKVKPYSTVSSQQAD
ncbi:YbaN family protein [Endozoicomonas sp. SM1973]|uniref:Inner membrane protein n=1 Tax=Spartinivicinus marinus TaxID=2994442 RepID=A0A853I4I6_9GAMM|nr:YbaN family protein [Spartinivicinus marinus]MCX4028766.1 YbaN family protein [Spartinivicinus marinus]NYZ67579.1 YbaN family protein [Spartinivicinus marinus]